MYILIVALHSIEKESKVKFEITLETFEYVLKLLSDNGYKSITLGQFYDFTKGIGTLPDKPVVITDDDGYQNIYTNAYPLLEKYGFSMTLFLSLEYIMELTANRVTMNVPFMPPRQMLLWKEVKELASKGFDIQSHGVYHGNYSTYQLDKSIWNIKRSKEVIENEIQNECAFHAWCNSNTDQRLWDKMPELGIKGFLRYSGGIENTSTVDWKAMKRVYIEEIMSRETIRERLLVKGAGDK